ncbi:hypothetical protein SAMN04488104_101343 [Algoriphagus faecimaris]|uniref:Uncharacterized protein n=1 Tax=Algoriphagus faecimaris TaxID=686796 RepID=A0A1G6RL73_9BACT|nr:hypothetical protein [Algoriphagus faecimaris]SDD05308.1 hypothetical protein SAMN04488104_101343 [Algoriphagus faecimaris]
MKKILKRSLLIFALLMTAAGLGFAQNQFPSQIWHKGNIYGLDGQSFTGLVKYDLDNNLVQLQTDRIETFTASNVTYFEIFDEVYGGVRKFYSLPYSLNGDYETPIFFEILTEGTDIALLCREYIATDSRNMGAWGPMSMNPLWGPQTMAGYRLAFNYYFFKDNQIQKYSLKKKDLFTMLSDYEEEINLFMRKNRLEHDKRGDLLRITAYYNELNNN